MSIILSGSLPTASVSKNLSMVRTCETLTMESSEIIETLRSIMTLPGAAARFRFDVSMATTTVLMRLSLNESLWIITTGLQVFDNRDLNQVCPAATPPDFSSPHYQSSFGRDMVCIRINFSSSCDGCSE